MKQLAVALVVGLSALAGAAVHAAHGAAGTAGRIVYTRQDPYDGGRGQLYLANANGTGLVALTNTGYGANNSQPAWSPNGSQIAFESNRRGDTDLWTIAPDASALKELTFSAGFDGDPTWDPSETKIAFETNRNGNFDVYVINADGSGQRRLTTDAANDMDPAWSPDGTSIAFTSDRSGSRQIWTMNADGSNEQQVTDSPALDALPAYSPNGQSIVFESDRGAKNNRDLYVTDVGGGNQHRLFADSRYWDVAPSWGPTYGNAKCTITGTIHDDTIVGTSGSDVMCGLGGRDWLLGGAGNDVFYAKDGRHDVITGGPGRDVARLDRKLDITTGVEVKLYR